MAKNLMILGTASTVGKSILTAAFCRIFKQEGYQTAPFKSQNMALNSYVTKDGKEMGRAQVVQAEASGLEPMVEMNPILLKPTSDVGSQVILNGKVFKNMTATEYFAMKNSLKPEILKAYKTLEEQFDMIILEGAGSPAEINLKEDDIVNMGMAEMVDAPVILVGDIDKGGVFASLYGTIMLLEPEERARIKGYIINKFRGDETILQPGIDLFYEKLPLPCLGVIPYMKMNIDDEDSVTTRFDRKQEGAIIIGIIRLPYMSNFTDFTVFDLETDVSVRYIHDDSSEEVDLIVIPGSKNTLKDMEFLHESGLAAYIYRAHRGGIPIIGVCGGYQMLGRTISDPFNVETTQLTVNGLGLLAARTSMSQDKKTVRIKGAFETDLTFAEATKDMTIEGYEIHMGITDLFEDTRAAIRLEDGREDGAVNPEGNVFGTYLHGIFDNDNFRNTLLNNIRTIKGIEATKEIDYKSLKEAEYNKLADIVRNHVNLDEIKKIIGV
ncbi:MAG: cobyric acid synthase CobQ [Firmicutes bacterium HGW-Firmicutes-7]|nr:MAG: cobyric acid synthase CobQ [Firmicutes bacterium HGW-Firmicutes-7]